jgi:hypothetical protein
LHFPGAAPSCAAHVWRHSHYVAPTRRSTTARSAASDGRSCTRLSCARPAQHKSQLRRPSAAPSPAAPSWRSTKHCCIRRTQHNTLLLFGYKQSHRTCRNKLAVRHLGTRLCCARPALHKSMLHRPSAAPTPAAPAQRSTFPCCTVLAQNQALLHQTHAAQCSAAVWLQTVPQNMSKQTGSPTFRHTIRSLCLFRSDVASCTASIQVVRLSSCKTFLGEDVGPESSRATPCNTASTNVLYFAPLISARPIKHEHQL